MPKRGDIVTIYSFPVQGRGLVGDAELIELVDQGGDTAKTEKWLVRFIGEHKLETRKILKDETEEPEPEPKLKKKLSASGHIQYRPKKKKAPKMEAYEEDGVIKYRYKKMREDQARNYDDPFTSYLKQIGKK